MRYLKPFTVLALATTLACTTPATAFAAIPQGYWQYQQPFADAKAANNPNDILRIGEQIVSLFTDLPMDNDKAGILYTTSEAMYPVYEKQGNYEQAIVCLNRVIECGTVLGFTDGVKLAKARIQKIEPQTEVYALSQNTSALPYYHMKHEPKNGTYFGRVFTTDGLAPTENETAVSFYVEFLQDNIADYDYLIRPYADGKRIIHIALNMPNENDSLKAAQTADSYINDFASYVASLNAPVLVRIGGEMNVWQNLAEPELYKRVYVKIATAIRAKAQNAALVFSPNDISNWNADIASYYPGDAYVDWVGVSLYTDKFRDAKNPVAKEDFEEMYYGNGVYANPISKLRDIVERYGDKKPIIITEGATGHSIYGNDSVDLTAFAKNRINMLYTYANMVYPQVKGIIYFDNALQTDRYNYSMSQKPELMAAYSQATAQNPGLLTEIGQSPSAYVKLNGYNDNLSELQLATYCILPGNILVNVSYILDNDLFLLAKEMPYSCRINAAALSEGNHSLKVVVKGENGYQKEKNYTLVKSSSGQLTVTETNQ